MVRPDYNRIAWCYDALARVVFGPLLERAKQALLEEVREGSKVLVVGGGTGKILACLGAKGKALSVDFVELSANMLARARRQKTTNLAVRFHQGDIRGANGAGYDVIITNFFFSQFRSAEVAELLLALKPKLVAGGVLLFSDFTAPACFSDRLTGKLMYLFFRLATGIKASSFPDYDSLFAGAGFAKLLSRPVGRNIVAAVYKPVA